MIFRYRQPRVRRRCAARSLRTTRRGKLRWMRPPEFGTRQSSAAKGVNFGLAHKLSLRLQPIRGTEVGAVFLAAYGRNYHLLAIYWYLLAVYWSKFAGVAPRKKFCAR